ncbi:MAG: hypothetical protein FWF77_02095, partial [Defluviitaleaceae bacterium]|nr:hypothetical protein [Defluviitaleaceae bacterium]
LGFLVGKNRIPHFGLRGVCFLVFYTNFGLSSYARKRREFQIFAKARQARGGNRGHVSEATRSLEAGRRFLARQKRAKRAVGTGGMCRRRRIPSKPETVSRSIKKMSRRVSLADSFLQK